LVNTLYYIILFGVFGLPIWYFTTSTYRAPLPFNEIYEISSLKDIGFEISFDLVYVKNDISTDELKNIKDKLINEFEKGMFLSINLII
jgi:hypothetical protein